MIFYYFVFSERYITKNEYTEIFFRCYNGKCHQEKIDIFNIFAQNIHCGYTL